NATDFKVNPRSLGPGSLFGMTPKNPVIQTMAATPIAPGVHAHSIIAVAGNGPIEGSNDGVVEYSSSHLDGVDSEYIVRPARISHAAGAIALASWCRSTDRNTHGLRIARRSARCWRLSTTRQAD